LNNDEFSALENFGKKIEDTKIKEPNFKIKKNKKYNKKTFFEILKKIFNTLKALLRISIRFFKNIIKKFKWWNYNKKLKRALIKKAKNKNRQKTYKIIEKKKTFFNTIFIIRKRVPIRYLPNFQEKNKGSAGLYYMNCEKDSHNKIFFNEQVHYKLKESIWDFPEKEKKKWSFLFFWLR